MNKTDAEVYQQKLSHAKRLIDIHNYLRRPTHNDIRITYEDFVQNLVDMGGSSNEMLQQVTANDLNEVCMLPVLMSRRLSEIFQEDAVKISFDNFGAALVSKKEG